MMSPSKVNAAKAALRAVFGETPERFNPPVIHFPVVHFRRRITIQEVREIAFDAGRRAEAERLAIADEEAVRWEKWNETDKTDKTDKTETTAKTETSDQTVAPEKSA